MPIGLDAEVELSDKRVRDAVAGEDDVLRARELVADHVAQRVVFLVEVEDGGMGYTWEMVRSATWLGATEARSGGGEVGRTGLRGLDDFAFALG